MLTLPRGVNYGKFTGVTLMGKPRQVREAICGLFLLVAAEGQTRKLDKLMAIFFISQLIIFLSSTLQTLRDCHFVCNFCTRISYHRIYTSTRE